MPRMVRLPLALCGAALSLLALAAPVAGRPDGGPIYQQGLQWGLERINAPAAWPASQGDGVTIAVIDSGADLNHVDLRDRIVSHVSCIGAAGDKSRCSGSGQDDNGHGTHVSGIALAATTSGKGVSGVAPRARLMIVRVLSNDCSGGRCTASGSAADVAAGIDWAVENGADVINLSLGGGAVQSVLGCAFCDAINDAWREGVIAVIAAGNDSVLPSGFSNEPAVIVTATTRDNARASYSNSSGGLIRQARWPVAAPGGEGETDPKDCSTTGTPKGILSTYWMAGHSDSYACLAGTSMAAPHVAGTLALLRARGLGPEAAIDRLIATAKDLGPAGRDDTFGYGLIDAGRAVGAGAPVQTTATTTTQPVTSAPSETSPPTTEPPPTTTTTAAPPTTEAAPVLPGPREAAPFTPDPSDPGGDGGGVPAGLAALAVAAVLASGAGTASAAVRLTTRA